MSDIATDDTYWRESFDVTHDDLVRLECWLEEQQRGVTLEELAQYVVRNRLQFGDDESLAALPEWVQEMHVLSWDEEDMWEVGSRVFVLRQVLKLTSKKDEEELEPSFGVIKEVTDRSFEIELDTGRTIKYWRVEPGSKDAIMRFESLKRAVWKIEQLSREPNRQITLEEQGRTILMKHGPRIASRILSALVRDQRFEQWQRRWYLRKWADGVSINLLHRIHRESLQDQKSATISELQDRFKEVPQGDMGRFVLATALAHEPGLFRATEGSWEPIKAPPPPWQRAVGMYFVYDPATYQIILQPRQRLKREQAERLENLGLYADMVTTADS